MALKFKQVKGLGNHPMLSRPREAYEKHHYSTPFFVVRETLNAFRQHNGFSISASLSFYAMFALIPLALLIFFTLSHLIISSDYAIVKLAILTGNLLPQFSNRIMLEVYNVSGHQAAWGAFGIFALLWIVTPLASALRSAFYTIVTMMEAPSFIVRKIKDVIAVIGILLMFFLFTLSGLVLEKIVNFLQPVAMHTTLISSFSSLLLTTLMIAVFYRVFFPVRVTFRYILIGSLTTAILWLAMRPAFALFLSMNESYGAVFGSMKNMFISIAWLYYTFAIFLIGTELIATLRKKDVLFLRDLFLSMPRDSKIYLRELMSRYGKTLHRGDYVFRQGESGRDIYYIVSGNIDLISNGSTIRTLAAGSHFGEMALLANARRIVDAQAASDQAEIVTISADNMETLLLSEPQLALGFLKQMARRLQSEHPLYAH
ncbi:MAG TPA: YhjD/YihY/BrkB family envelope integrity protein [Methylophilaceae bacterium]|nr:YhjD/YihY/BrkB family envelope integrity protein [Methylophilaceae bacterium]